MENSLILHTHVGNFQMYKTLSKVSLFFDIHHYIMASYSVLNMLREIHNISVQ